MRVLLDTHILLWWLADDPLLPEEAAAVIADGDNEVTVSAATVWEITIKQAAGRLEAPDDLVEALAANDFDSLAMTAEHAILAGRLPTHHTDPFDRMLIAQAQTEGLILLSVDSRFAHYGVDVLPMG